MRCTRQLASHPFDYPDSAGWQPGKRECLFSRPNLWYRCQDAESGVSRKPKAKRVCMTRRTIIAHRHTHMHYNGVRKHTASDYGVRVCACVCASTQRPKRQPPPHSHRRGDWFALLRRPSATWHRRHRSFTTPQTLLLQIRTCAVVMGSRCGIDQRFGMRLDDKQQPGCSRDNNDLLQHLTGILDTDDVCPTTLSSLSKQ